MDTGSLQGADVDEVGSDARRCPTSLPVDPTYILPMLPQNTYVETSWADLCPLIA